MIITPLVSLFRIYPFDGTCTYSPEIFYVREPALALFFEPFFLFFLQSRPCGRLSFPPPFFFLIFSPFDNMEETPPPVDLPLLVRFLFFLSLRSVGECSFPLPSWELWFCGIFYVFPGGVREISLSFFFFHRKTSVAAAAAASLVSQI